MITPMNNTQSLLANIIKNFSAPQLSDFFHRQSRSYRPAMPPFPLTSYDETKFLEGQKIGEIEFTKDGYETLIVCTFRTVADLSQRSSKKAQYEQAKQIFRLNVHQNATAGIFVFYDNNGHFRFSLVYPEYQGVKKSFSNFRRFTYFVSNESSITNRTFQTRILECDFASLTVIKEAFAVGPVTKLFYDEFSKQYERLVSATAIANDISEHEKARNFVLLFAIRTIFMGFIQKRGWLGEDKRFIRSMLAAYEETGEQDAFYNNWLAVLFFEALNGKRADVASRRYLPDKVRQALLMAPYLNGGLFKKRHIDEQGWFIPDTGLKDFLNFLFSHDFTIEESSLDDVDLQLNPEFLGIIFEKLVNKKNGTVYTPRPEVDLMCRLSLLKWLQKTLSFPGNKTEKLYALFFKGFEGLAEQEGGVFSSTEAEEIVAALEGLVICDPAAGSGAFLVGMLQVILEIEETLHQYLPHNDSLNHFDRKRDIIGRSLYGVEVQEWAVWIAQLRLWLSLFIDAPEEMRDSPTAILPSLDFKVRVGDALVQRLGDTVFPVLGGVSLSNTTKTKIADLKRCKNDFFANNAEQHAEVIRHCELEIYRDILSSEIKKKEAELQKMSPPLGSERLLENIPMLPLRENIDFSKNKRANIKEQIEKLERQRMSLRDEKPLIWSIEFAEIFAERRGFDIVIGNPPYVRQEAIADPLSSSVGEYSDKRGYKQQLATMVRIDFPKYFQKGIPLDAKSDLYVYFYIRSLRLLNPQGVHTFICSNSWLDVGYGAWLQEFLLRSCRIDLLIDNHTRSFADADINTIISVIHAPCGRVPDEHLVKFVAFKKPFEEAIRRESLLCFERAREVFTNETLRVYPISNGELLEAGLDEKALGGKHAGKYMGDKWGGKYLRAPDIFFTVLAKGKGKLVRLGDVAEVRFGVKTGVNEFFYLTEERIRHFGIEEEFLKPVIKSPRECRTILIDPAKLKYKLFICNKSKEELRGTNALKYIEWGEQQKMNTNVSIASRKQWYSLGNEHTGTVVWSMMHAKMHMVYLNKKAVNIDHNFFEIITDEALIEKQVFSTLSIFMKELMGRTYGGGSGPIKNEGVDIKTYFILKPFLLKKLERFSFSSSREIENVFNECGIDPRSPVPIEKQKPNPLPDRAELDNIIFEALGLSAAERQEVYRAVCCLVWRRLAKARSL